MRIVLVNWARVEDGAAHGGGVNGYCQAIGLELANRGHSVTCLSSGTAYELDARGPALGPCAIGRRPDWNGLETYEVVNSPVLAPSMAQFREPLAEISVPELEKCFTDFLKLIRPDVVHFNNIEGLSAACVAAAREVGARVVYSLHNYHTICPQVYLMQGHRRPCFGFDNGHSCTTCIPTVDPSLERIRIASKIETPEAPPRPPKPVPMPWESIDVPAWRPLLNVIAPETASDKPPNAYAVRRKAMLDMLAQCDAVLAVSDFVRRKFESVGLPSGRARTLHIGSRMADLAGAPSALPKHSGPVRIAFMGYNNWPKGLPMLIDSLELLTPEYLCRLDLTVLALNSQGVEPQLRRLEPRLAGLRIVDGYRYESLPELLAGVELGVVPSVWWDNAPQTVMEFRACGIPVLGANLGGIPEFIEDGVDGLLFAGNDRWDLARHLAKVARNPETLTRLRAAVRPPLTIRQHVTDLEQEYQNRIS